MFTRHLFAAAALMAATCGAHADVVSTSTPSGMTSDMNIVDSTSASGGDLASMLAASNGNSRFYVVRGVEGLYMLASRTTSLLPDSEATDITVPALADVPLAIDPPALETPVADVPVAADADPVLPVLEVGEVPEPGSLALMLAGVLGAAGFTRARKQG